MRIGRVLMLVVCAIAATGISMAQGLAEIFKGNEEMTRLFVNPLGIDNAMSLNDAKEIEATAAKEGLQCKVSSMGEIGQIANISSPDITIGGVKVADMYILAGKNSSSIAYQSQPSDNYKDMIKFLDKSLAGFAKIAENGDVSGNFNVYIIGEQYGVAVGSIDEKKVAFAYMVDIKDLNGFMQMGGELMKTITE